MLIDSDAHGGGNASGAPTDAEGLFKRLKRDIKTNSRSGPFQSGLAHSKTMRPSASLPAALVLRGIGMI